MIKIYDNQGKTADQYTVIIGQDVYTMSANATAPNGVNMYAGQIDQDISRQCIDAGLVDNKRLELYQAPQPVLLAIIDRMAGDLQHYEKAARQRPRIEKITLAYYIDEDPALDYLGEYTSQPQPAEDIKRHSVIVHDRHNPRTHDFWVPQISVQEHRDGLSKLGYSKGNAEYMARQYVRQDYNRHCSHGMDWTHIGIIARAVISTDCGNGSRRLETVTSGGLWGIQSDSEPAYIAEIEQEELADLKSHLENLNVDTSDFADKAPQATGHIGELQI